MKSEPALLNRHQAGTAFRPGSLTDEPGTGRVAIADTTGRGGVPRADLAEVLAELLDAPHTSGQTLELIGDETPIGGAVAARGR